MRLASKYRVNSIYHQVRALEEVVEEVKAKKSEEYNNNLKLSENDDLQKQARAVIAHLEDAVNTLEECAGALGCAVDEWI